jgi:hypothetical protein
MKRTLKVIRDEAEVNVDGLKASTRLQPGHWKFRPSVMVH